MDVLSWSAAGLLSMGLWLLLQAAHLRRDPRILSRASMLALPSDSLPAHGVIRGRFATLARTPLACRMATRLSENATVLRRIEQAGATLTLNDVAAQKLVAWGGAGVVSLLCVSIGPPLFVLAPFVLAIAARGPDLLLARRARRRRNRMQRQVPELAELVVAATEAGLPPSAAFARAAGALAAPLGDELRSAVRQVELGVPWRDTLDEVVERLDVRALAELARTLARSQRLGASVRASLRAVVAELRAERQARAEELARRAPVKMLFPLVLLILPAFLLLTVGPVLLSTIRSLH